MRMVVVLPAPLGPRKPKTSPRQTARSDDRRQQLAEALGEAVGGEHPRAVGGRPGRAAPRRRSWCRPPAPRRAPVCVSHLAMQAAGRPGRRRSRAPGAGDHDPHIALAERHDEPSDVWQPHRRRPLTVDLPIIETWPRPCAIWRPWATVVRDSTTTTVRSRYRRRAPAVGCCRSSVTAFCCPGQAGRGAGLAPLSASRRRRGTRRPPGRRRREQERGPPPAPWPAPRSAACAARSCRPRRAAHALEGGAFTVLCTMVAPLGGVRVNRLSALRANRDPLETRREHRGGVALGEGPATAAAPRCRRWPPSPTRHS